MLTHLNSSNIYYVHKIDANGVSLHQTTTFATVNGGLGNLAYTPNSVINPGVGEVAFCYSGGNNTRLFSQGFDATTGLYVAQPATNHTPAIASLQGSSITYDVEWSPNGRVLYFGGYRPTRVVMVDVANNQGSTLFNGVGNAIEQG